MAHHMKTIAAGMTDAGLQRDHNEDNYAILPEHRLFIVADGMGGERAGDVASRLTTESIADFFRSTNREDATWPFHFDTALSEHENRLASGIRVANRQIFERSVRSRDCAGMGATVVCAIFSPEKGRMYVGHVGDCRAYRVRAGTIAQLTRDHSLYNDYIEAMPELTEEQRAALPKNIVTRALGMNEGVAVDMLNDEPQAGDAYLLCSDGLSGMVADARILDIVSSTEDAHDACRRLVVAANEQGGEDNITVILIRMTEDDTESDAPNSALEAASDTAQEADEPAEASDEG
ncbi:Stp1/IreP family PP2C-type Ser/Thr phosphatase [Sorangium sp. So ce388]|uniref:Stp1/IreP family PP2C-type Ser/Thr phosphatase n=1 Tax=Sorangium sp. So ce388 TaxID=3133309 RepID=UPI003F5B6C5C